MSLVHQDSVNVQINDNSVVDDGYVQMMPFTIEHNGAAKVDEYFTYERGKVNLRELLTLRRKLL